MAVTASTSTNRVPAPRTHLRRERDRRAVGDQEDQRRAGSTPAMPARMIGPEERAGLRTGHQRRREDAADTQAGEQVAVAVGTGAEDLVAHGDEQHRVDAEHQGRQNAVAHHDRRRRRRQDGPDPDQHLLERTRARRPRSRRRRRLRARTVRRPDADDHERAGVDATPRPRAVRRAAAVAPIAGPAITVMLSMVLRKRVGRGEVALGDDVRSQPGGSRVVDRAEGRGHGSRGQHRPHRTVDGHHHRHHQP